MTILKVCVRHGLVPATGCPACKQAEKERKRTKRIQSGYYSPHWKQLRQAALNRDGHICQRCGQPATSVHLRPELQANHLAATLDDCTSLCRSCHGRLDGARAHH